MGPMSGWAARDSLIAWINHRLEIISETQHRLAAEKSVLQEQATLLRLGAPADAVEVTLKHAGLQVPRAARQGGRRVAT